MLLSCFALWPGRESVTIVGLGVNSAEGMSMLPVRQHRAFESFCDAAYSDESLGAKTTLMLKLATAMAAGCVP